MQNKGKSLELIKLPEINGGGGYEFTTGSGSSWRSRMRDKMNNKLEASHATLVYKFCNIKANY